ncbi:hypothetical protein M231_02812 [Tremella mesenterica]|uniref:Uncharacterized protein n=1 Tax=Tremella mesenterica TaxID=5217 RepID=A0A4Q1BPP3_TREME|nr:hypothetical protein M231_02812 [Tremella mesenterica]
MDLQAEKWSTWNTSLYTPPNIVSSSEKSQIEVLIPEWAEKLLDSSLIIPQLKRPLRPFFLHPATSSPPQIPDDPEWTSIICLSASRWVGGEDDIPASTKVGKRTKGFEYVQGAGDDDELWAKGLTPAIFYKHKQVLLSADQDDLEKLVFELVRDEPHQAALSITHSGPEIPFDRLTISDPLVGIPNSNSLLALDIGPAVSSSPWQYHHREAITIYVVEPVKHPKEYDETYILPVPFTLPSTSTSSLTTRTPSSSAQPLTNTDFSGNVPHLDDHRGKRGRRFVLLLPSPRSSGKVFSQSLIEARNFISSLIEDGQPVILRPGRSEHWDRARTSFEAISNTPTRAEHQPKIPCTTSGNSKDEIGDVMPTVEDRRRIIPLALLALCSIPHLSQFSPSQPQRGIPSSLEGHVGYAGSEISLAGVMESTRDHREETRCQSDPRDRPVWEEIKEREVGTIPKNEEVTGEMKKDEVMVDKSSIADKLYKLVSLWPDGNPPRAALKRVNEILMS